MQVSQELVRLSLPPTRHDDPAQARPLLSNPLLPARPPGPVPGMPLDPLLPSAPDSYAGRLTDEGRRTAGRLAGSGESDSGAERSAEARWTRRVEVEAVRAAFSRRRQTLTVRAPWAMDRNT